MAKFGGGMPWLLGSLAAVAIACGVTAAAPPFVERKGTRFVVNGSTFLFNGFNTYWMMNEAAVPDRRTEVTRTLSEAAAAGLTVCRTWAFNDGGQAALQISPGVYNEQVFQGLDFVISEAGKHGIRLVLALVNNYKDFGGKPQYVEWARAAGVNVGGDDDFFTNPTVKSYLKNHIERVLTRVNTVTRISYRDDPTIMAWELMNEPQCHADLSGKTVTAWAGEMARFTKSIDKKHLLAVGIEGLYGDSTPEKVRDYNPNGVKVGTDFIGIHQIDEFDYASFHAYPDSWLAGRSEEEQTAFLKRWMWIHWEDSVKRLGKPVVLGEFGKSRRDAGSSDHLRNAFLAAVYGGMFGYAGEGGGSFGGGMVWQLFTSGMESYGDGYEIVLPRDRGARAVMAKQSRAMKVLARRLSRERKGGGRGVHG